MKKVITWILTTTFIILLFDLGIMGLKLLHYDYDIFIEAYIGYACFLIIFICGLFKLFTIFTKKCPYCRKLQITKGMYCPYCGKKM